MDSASCTDVSIHGNCLYYLKLLSQYILHVTYFNIYSLTYITLWYSFKSWLRIAKKQEKIKN